MIPEPPIRLAHTKAPLVLTLVAGAFTLLGAVLAVGLDRFAERHVLEELGKQEAAVHIATRAQRRWFRSLMVVQAVDSSLFRDRWEVYVSEGLVPWNDDYFLLRARIRRYFPEVQQEFDQLQDAFEDLQSSLLAYWRSGGSPSQTERDRAEEQLRLTREKVEALTNKIVSDS